MPAPKPWMGIAVVAGLTHSVGCAPPPPPEEPAPSPAVEVSPPAAAQPAPSNNDVIPRPSTTAPTPAWRTPLPRLALDRMTSDQVQAAQACSDGLGASVSDATDPAALSRVAACMGKIPAPGREIAILRVLLQRFPDSAEARDALRTMAARYEQVDQLDMARLSLTQYLERYPKEDDARTLGQRAVCLALALGMAERADELLQTLLRLYGRRRFVRPSDGELRELCGLE